MRLFILTNLKPTLMLFAALLFGSAPQIAAAEDIPQPQEYPRILKAIEQQGLTILGEMKVPGGLAKSPEEALAENEHKYEDGGIAPLETITPAMT